mgnify:CR=1 FL=1
MSKILKKIKNINILFIIICLGSNLFNGNKIIYAKDKLNENIDNRYTIDSKNSFYILGSGDKLEISVIETEDNKKEECIIDNSGKCSLKRIGRVYAKGLTIEEFSKKLNQKYKDYYIKPNTNISLIRYRAIKTYIHGEVKIPGLYSFNIENNENSQDIPTVYDLIRTSGGITELSDLSKIEIIRNNSVSNGGGKIKTNLNFLKIINENDTEQNLSLMDGDIIKINKLKNGTETNINLSNLNPPQISIYISGRVQRPGAILLNNKAALNDAIAISGGINSISGPISFARFNYDGTTDKRVFKYKPNSKRGTYTNPYLKQDDIVFVGKSKLNVATEIITSITEPLSGIVSVYGIYKIFDD